MKKLFLLIAFTGLVLSINAQETLKIKTVKTDYGRLESGSYYRIGELDGVVINADTLSSFVPNLIYVNISNDTFASGVRYEITMDILLYDDTGLLLARDRASSPRIPVNSDFFPNDTSTFGLNLLLLDIIDAIKEEENIDLEQIAYWQIIGGVSYTSQDGTYSERVFYEGADTSTFYVVRGNVGIQEIENGASVISVFPNPARSQFTVANAENASLQLYNMSGQEVLRIHNKGKNTVVNVDFLSEGIYVLKVLKDGVFSTHKIVINNSKY
jgi:hypothetical protein